jgi:predicted phosphodiesterase
MRVAALYDVHGNLPALEAVLADPRCAGADVLVCGGDLVAGPLPAECLDALEAERDRVRFLAGNGDRETVSPPDEGPLAESGRWSAARLGPARLERVAAWPATVELELGRLGTVLFCHGTPGSDTEILTAITPVEEAAAALGRVEAGVVVCGHTHVQYDREVAGVRLVNAGSVGMPYEGSADARWALLGPDGVELVSTPYDAEAAMRRLAETGYPLLDERFGPVLRGEVTAAEATEVFERRRGP